MAAYQCIVQEGTLDPRLRPQLAREIMRIHTERTGAPIIFSHVFFLELKEGSVFTGGEPSHATFINGKIRAGRTVDVRQQMLVEIAAMWSTLTGQPEHELVIAIEEVVSETTMEDGVILPKLGEEWEWFQRNYDHFLEIGLMGASHS